MQQVKIEYITKYGIYKDAIYLPNDHSYTEDEISIMKQQKFDNWFASMTNSSIEEI